MIKAQIKRSETKVIMNQWSPSPIPTIHNIQVGTYTFEAHKNNIRMCRQCVFYYYRCCISFRYFGFVLLLLFLFCFISFLPLPLFLLQFNFKLTQKPVTGSFDEMKWFWTLIFIYKRKKKEEELARNGQSWRNRMRVKNVRSTICTYETYDFTVSALNVSHPSAQIIWTVDQKTKKTMMNKSMVAFKPISTQIIKWFDPWWLVEQHREASFKTEINKYCGTQSTKTTNQPHTTTTKGKKEILFENNINNNHQVNQQKNNNVHNERKKWCK